MSTFKPSVMKKDSYALITGAANRIGRSMALELAQVGFHILIHYRNSEEDAEQLKTEIEHYGRKAETVRIDFMKEEDYDGLFNLFKRKNIIIDLLVNSASDFSPSKFTDKGDDILMREFKSNFHGAYMLTKAFGRVFGKGLVVNLLDTKISKDVTTHFDYLLSKKLLAEFTRMAAIELAPEIRVNGICPGLVLPPAGKDQNYLLNLAKDIPLKRIGSLTDIQRTLRFFVESEFVTGQLIYVDGGDHLAH